LTNCALTNCALTKCALTKPALLPERALLPEKARKIPVRPLRRILLTALLLHIKIVHPEVSLVSRCASSPRKQSVPAARRDAIPPRQNKFFC
jgi:hypothetical protein